MRIQALAPALLLLLWANASRAQHKASSSQNRPNTSQAKSNEEGRSASNSATAAKAIQHLQRQVNALRQEMDRKNNILQGDKEPRSKMEFVESRLDKIELGLEAMKMQLAGKGDIAGFDHGFYIQSPNRMFFLRLGALIQAAYIGRIYSVSENTSNDLLGENESTFALRRAGLEVSGNLFLPQLTYFMTLVFGPLDPGPILEGYGEILVHRLLKLRIGKQKIPLGRQFLISSANQQFVERSSVVGTFAPGWDLGALVYGDVSPGYGLLSYKAGIFNGAGTKAAANENIDFLYAAYLLYEPLGHLADAEGDLEHSKFKLAIGGAFSYNLALTDLALRKGITDPGKAALENDLDGDGKTDNVGIYTVGAELTARMNSVSWQNEVFFRVENPGAAADKRRSWGLYSQAGMIPHWRQMEFAARYGYWEPHYYGQDQSPLLPGTIHEVTAVINILAWQRLVKWQLEYAHQWQRNFKSLTQTPDTSINLNQVRLQLQTAF